MPINTDNAYESVKFAYTNERDESFALDLEFHHTIEFGPSITIHNLAGGPVTLPASAYVEAVDYLRSRGSIKGGMPPAAKTAPAARSAGTRLAPTRTTNAATTRSPVHQVQRPEVYEPSTPPGYEQPQGYAQQVMIMASEGAVESFSAPPPPPRPKPRPAPQPAPEYEEEQQEEEEGLDPEFSLKNGKQKKEEAKIKVAGRSDRIKKKILPGEPGYEEQQAAIAAFEAQ